MHDPLVPGAAAAVAVNDIVKTNVGKFRFV
jgi:hypothetical protein